MSLHVCVLDRGKVVGGLPDVVTIMEKKVSNLRDCLYIHSFIFHIW